MEKNAQDIRESADIEKVYLEYQSRVMAYISSRISSREEAEDLQSEVFLKVCKNADRFDTEKASISTWIYTITRNTLTDYFRIHKTSTELPEDLEWEADPYEEIYQEETLDELAEALKTLDDEERDLIVLHYYENLPLTEICERIGMSYGKTKLLHNQALKKLRQKMDGRAFTVLSGDG